MSAAWVRVSSSRSASVGGQFHADEVFKHFVGPVQPYDDQSVQMSREAYLQDLKRWGLIETPDDQTMQAIKAAANPRIRVHGKFGPRGAFVIHVVESEPPPTSEPWFMPKVGIAFLRGEMYSLRLPDPYFDIPLEYLTEHTGYTPGKIEFAGKVSDAWDEVRLYRPRVWRVEFGQRRGRRKGSDSHPTLGEMEQALRDLKPHYPKWPPKNKFLQMLGRSRDDVRRVNEWLEPYHLNYTALVQSIYRAPSA
jgi:hypothetical protein